MLKIKFQPVDQNQISQLIEKLKNKACYGHDNTGCAKKKKDILNIHIKSERINIFS